MQYALACLIAAAIAAGGTWFLLSRRLDWLGRLELGIRDIPATGRDLPAEDGYVPRCGGLFMAAGAFVAALLGLLSYSIMASPGASSIVPRLSTLQTTYIWGGMLLPPLFAAAAFLEDYALVFRRMARGIAGWKRLLIQLAVILAFLAAVWLGGDGGAGATVIPFVGEVRLGLWYYIGSLILILAVVRGSELTQKADGAAPVLGFFSFLPVVAAAGFLASVNAGALDAGVLGVAGAAACLAFLPANFPPASTRTGRAGGAFMGALVCAACFALRMPVLLPLIGLTYIAEAVTALFAWATERLTGKAVGAPLHHMIGRKGNGDASVVVTFAVMTALAGALAAALAIFGK